MVDSVLSTAGVLVQGLSRFAYTALVARVLGSDALAAVNLAFSVSILLSLLWPTAAGNAAAAYVRPGRSSAMVRGRLLRSTVVATAVLAPLGVVAAVALGLDVVPAVLTGLLTLSWSAYIFARGLRMGVGQVLAAAVWDAISGIVSIVLLVLLLLLQLDAWLIAPAAIGYASFAAACLMATRRAERSSAAAPAGIPPLRTTIAWSSLSLVASNGVMQLTMVVAYGFDSSTRAGLFAAALSLATPMSMIAQAVTQAMLPRFLSWRSMGRDEELRLLRRTSLALTVVIGAGCAVVAMLLPWVLPLVYGARFAGAVPLAQWLMVAVFGFSLTVFFAAYLAAVGRARAATLAAGGAAISGALIMVVVGLVAGGVAGALSGAGIGMSLSAALLAILAMRPSSLR